VADLSRHAWDAVSLVSGLLCLTLGGLFLLHDTTSAGIDLRWAAPVALILIGLVGLAASARRPRSR